MTETPAHMRINHKCMKIFEFLEQEPDRQTGNEKGRGEQGEGKRKMQIQREEKGIRKEKEIREEKNMHPNLAETEKNDCKNLEQQQQESKESEK